MKWLGGLVKFVLLFYFPVPLTHGRRETVVLVGGTTFQRRVVPRNNINDAPGRSRNLYHNPAPIWSIHRGLEGVGGKGPQQLLSCIAFFAWKFFSVSTSLRGTLHQLETMEPSTSTCTLSRFLLCHVNVSCMYRASENRSWYLIVMLDPD